MKLLFIGDIVGQPGRDAVKNQLPEIASRHAIDCTIANAENAAGGLGITPAIADELLAAGVDVITTGNHVWRHRDFLDYAQQEPRVLRPLNYPPGAPGQGSIVYQTRKGYPLAVVNLLGRVFMEPLDCPFRSLDREIDSLHGKTSLIVVDMHAEASSEKKAFGWHFDGRVTAVVGTHTHVQTADERLLPEKTAYITDVGMTGPYDSIIGIEKQPVIERFLTGMPTRFVVAKGPILLNAVIIEADPETGRAISIQRMVELSQVE